MDVNAINAALFSWAKSNPQTLNGFKLNTCNKSGSIWWQRGESQIYLNYGWDGEPAITGNVDERALKPIDCSHLTSFEEIKTLFLDTSIALTHGLYM